MYCKKIASNTNLQPRFLSLELRLLKNKFKIVSTINVHFKVKFWLFFTLFQLDEYLNFVESVVIGTRSFDEDHFCLEYFVCFHAAPFNNGYFGSKSYCYSIR